MERKILRDVVENIPREPRPSFLSRERRDERKGKVLISMEAPRVEKPKGNTRWFVLGAILVIIIGVVLLNHFASASITITPKVEVIKLDSTVKAYRSPEAPHLLVYNLLEVHGEELDSLPAQGSKYVERKAGGKITVYNDYSSSPLRLIQNTRFKSSDGKIFRSYNAIVVPGKGSVEINVVADSPGEASNVAPSNFTLPGLAGGAMYDKVYARSKTPFTGGFRGDVNVVSESDLAKAKTNLESKLTAKLLTEVATKLNSDQIFFPDSYVTSFSFNEFADAGTVAESAVGDGKTQKVSMAGSLYAVVFDGNELAKSLARRELAGVGEPGVYISNWEELAIDLSHYDNMMEISELTIRVTGTAKFVWRIDEQDLKSSLASVAKNKYSEIFLNYSSIDRAEVKIHPFWRKTFPDEIERISVRVVLDETK